MNIFRIAFFNEYSRKTKKRIWMALEKNHKFKNENYIYEKDIVERQLLGGLSLSTFLFFFPETKQYEKTEALKVKNRMVKIIIIVI